MVGMAKAKSRKGYSIRASTKDDLRAIVGIYNWAVNQTFATIDSEPLDAEEAQAWWEMHGKRSLLLVSVDETGVIGWARLLPWKQRGFDVVECLVYVDRLPPSDDGRGPHVLTFVQRARTRELHSAAVDAVAHRHVDLDRRGANRFRRDRTSRVGQHVVKQRPAADEAGHGWNVHRIACV